MPYKPTGRPNGRPPKLPPNAGELVLKDLESRMDPSTRLVIPQLSKIARLLNVSRSSIKRFVKMLRDDGALELVCVKKTPTAMMSDVYYRIK